MFSTKTFTVLALLSASTLAAPPACVIGAVNTQDNPHDIAAVCKAKDVQDSINKNCGGAKDAAQQYFSEVCKGAGVTISSTSTSSNGDKSSSSSSASPSSDSSEVPTSSSSTTNDQAQASSSSSSETGGAARLGMDLVGLAAVGVFGLMVSL